MTRAIKRVFLDFVKEEEWLNMMSSRGYALINHKKGTYYFERERDGEYKYKVELLNAWKKKNLKEYFSSLDDIDVRVVASHGGRVYLRKRMSMDDYFILNDDIDERIKFYNRGSLLWGLLAFLLLLVSIAFLTATIILTQNFTFAFFICLIFS